MKKEIVALSLLLIILAGNVWNQRRLNGLTAELNALVEEAYASFHAGDRLSAEENGKEAERLWLSADRYTHIFIRHTDIDALTSAFCDYRAAIASGEGSDVFAAYLRLRTGLRSLREMEKLSAGSVF